MTEAQQHLLETFDKRGLDEQHGMNLLQNLGTVSDNCVGVADVWDGDAERSVEALLVS